MTDEHCPMTLRRSLSLYLRLECSPPLRLAAIRGTGTAAVHADVATIEISVT